MRALAIAAVLFLLGVSVSRGGDRQVSAHAKTRWRATVAQLPANADSDGSIYAISCGSPGNCTAVGSYQDIDGNWEGLLFTEKAGRWGRGVEAVLPANAWTDPRGGYLGTYLRSVSCVSAGNCTAVGRYLNDLRKESGLLLTETAGQWGVGVEATPPANTVGGSLDSVSCASAGNCTAVGSYGYPGRPLLLTEKAGQWATGVEAPMPPDWGGGPVYFRTISCSSEGRCSAVANYNVISSYSRDGGSTAGEGALLTNTGGTWRAVAADMPPDGPGEGELLTSVSCASAGNCAAIGIYSINIDSNSAPEGVLLPEISGTWRRGVTAIPPKHAQSAYWRNDVDLADISCPSPGNCVAVGTYHARNGSPQMTLLTEVAGTWRRGVKPVFARTAPTSTGMAISCAAPRNCTAVGVDSRLRGLLLTEIAGRWAPGVRTPVPTNWLSLVSCASPGNCGAVGSDAHGHGILLDSSTK